MKNEMDLTGFDQLEKNLASLSGEHEMPIDELMTPKFISSCSKYSNFDELLKFSGFERDSLEGFEAIPNEKWDSFIQENTTYENWQKMRMASWNSYVEKKLTEGLK